MRDKKLTPEQRADEVCDRFYLLNDKDLEDTGTNPYISRRLSILCALEIVKEVKYQLDNVSYDNTYRSQYWNEVEQILTDRLL